MRSYTPSICELTPAEKLQLVEDLWDDIASIPEAMPMHDWQVNELERRKANLMRHPGSALSWDEVIKRVRARPAS